MAITQECCGQSWTSPGSNTHKTPTVRPPAPYPTKTIQVRRTRHAGHCWRSRDELIRDVLLWIPTHGRAKAGRPARTYIQQLCEDTGCCPEDLPRAMNDREEWRERVRDIRAASTIWWWWWYIYIYIYIYIYNQPLILKTLYLLINQTTILISCKIYLLDVVGCIVSDDSLVYWGLGVVLSR